MLRLLTPLTMKYEEAKRRAYPYNRIVEELPQMREETVNLVEQAVKEGKTAHVLVNNRLEGNAPETIRELRRRLRLRT